MLQRNNWQSLRQEADTKGLRIFAKLANVLELTEELGNLTDEAQALQNTADSEEGLSEDEQSRWEELLDEDKGEINAVGRRLQSAKKREGEQKRLAALRLAQDGPIENPLSGTEFDLQNGEMDPASQLAASNTVARSGKVNAFANDEDGKQKAYDCAMWLRSMVGIRTNRVDREAETHMERLGWDVNATATEGTDSAGGYLVPAPLEAAFIERREAVSVMRPLADRHSMTSKTLDVPKLVSGPAVTYPAEAAAPTPSDQVWSQVALSVSKRMVLSKVSNELRSNSLINAMDQLISRIAYELAKQEDNEAINGDGSGTYGSETGLLDALGTAGINAAAAGNTNWDALALADFTGTMGILPDDYWGSPSWLCSSSFYHAVMLRIQAEAGGNTIATLEAGGRMMPLFLGYPVHFTGRMPKVTAPSTVGCLFGTYSDGLMLGDAVGLEMGVSTDRYFDEDVTAVRATERIDWDVHEGGNGTDAGAYVGLATA